MQTLNYRYRYRIFVTMKNSNRETITLTRSQTALLFEMGEITRFNRDKYISMPYWFKDLGSDKYEVLLKEDLPAEMRKFINEEYEVITSDNIEDLDLSKEQVIVTDLK